ncbi:MAG: leucine-rich repeat domain-containing protein [Candidatus Lokiarchaeota archaeon]
MDTTANHGSKLNEKETIKRLKDIIFNSRDEKSRVDALISLGKVNQLKNYRFLENLFLTDENRTIRLIAGKFLLRNHIENPRLLDLLKYCVYNIEDIYQKIFVIKILLKINNKKSNQIIEKYYIYLYKKIFGNQSDYQPRKLDENILEIIREKVSNLILYDYYKNKKGYNVTLKNDYIILLNCEGSNLKTIDSIDGLEYITHLKYLKLQRTNLQKIIFSFKLRKLKVLDLSKNKIKKVENLEKLPNLQELYIENNDINKIENLESLANLRKLSFANNYIQKIEGLSTLSHMEELNLNNNNIKEIENLDQLVNLKYLNLSFNKIEEIKNIKSLQNLIRLYLNNNKIKKIQGLNNLILLKGLCLSDNQIEKIENLNQLSELRKLELSSNNIKELEGLEHLTKLQELFLDNNEIKILKGLDNLKNLIILFLKSNKIEKFNRKLIEPLTNLNFIFLNDNPLTPESKLCYNKRTRYP